MSPVMPVRMSTAMGLRDLEAAGSWVGEDTSTQEDRLGRKSPEADTQEDMTPMPDTNYRETSANGMIKHSPARLHTSTDRSKTATFTT